MTKLDPDANLNPHQSQNSGAVEAQNKVTEGRAQRSTGGSADRWSQIRIPFHEEQIPDPHQSEKRDPDLGPHQCDADTQSWVNIFNG